MGIAFNAKLDEQNTDVKTLKTYKSFCEQLKINNVDLVKMALEQFFENEKNQLLLYS